MSIESWLEVAVAVVSLIVLGIAGLADVSLTRKQRLSVREWLEGANGNTSQDNPVEQAASVRLTLMTLMLLSVVVLMTMITRLVTREIGSAALPVSLLAGLLAIMFVARGIPQAIMERYELADSDGIERMTQSLLVLSSALILLVDRGASLAGLVIRRGSSGSQSTSVLDQESGDRSESSSEPERIQDDEHEMISGILGMDEATAREIMVPRPDVISVPVDTGVQEVVQLVQQAGHSRIPVYEGSIDRIQGIVYAKDLLRFVHEDVTDATLIDIMRPAVFVPESKRVDDLLTDLRRSRVHIAIVVDEYGGTAGIVTIEDILEEIVGEIQDEYDRESPLYQFAASGEITVDGRIGVDELSELTGVELPETNNETVGGFVQQQLGHIPDVGESVEAGQLTIEVESVEGRRVRALRVRRSDQPGLDSTNSLRAS